MPQIFKIGKYIIYFWSNEGTLVQNATKIWITRRQGCVVANDNSKIPAHTLNLLLRVIEGRSFDIISKWKEIFGEISFYC